MPRAFAQSCSLDADTAEADDAHGLTREEAEPVGRVVELALVGLAGGETEVLGEVEGSGEDNLGDGDGVDVASGGGDPDVGVP